MKRNPRKLGWTKAFRKAHGKEMTMDATYEFEKKRNVAVKYDRELMGTTIRAMKRIAEIKEKREKQFYINRMKSVRGQQLAAMRREIETGQDLLMPAAVRAHRQKKQLEEQEPDMDITLASASEEQRNKVDEALAMEMDVEAPSEKAAKAKSKQAVKIKLKAKPKKTASLTP
eukprot:CAMPEP_0196661274 /NCGR_PEP_ID=MMETSP1086-20130531/43541_1 /TAXON_ID=77921 /ORGANISM="Cyanoptyche  gloeocystis , Strain SAG4.97" /LENGTH=171 /DNA_ID=CAMNT_0041996091 /DNA_START=77 /DNA_END=588 /DNA_ORIENTATION=+